MADVKIIDINSEQWNIKDETARNKIENISSKLSEVLEIQFHGTFNFMVKIKYIAEDINYIYYIFWWEPQSPGTASVGKYIDVLPPNSNTDKILTLNLNILQGGNNDIIQKTQHQHGENNSGMITFISGNTDNEYWLISGMGILRRIK